MSLASAHRDILHLALFICATDGLISNREEEMVLSLFRSKVSDTSEEELQSEVEKFFSGKEQLEDFAKNIKKLELRKLAIFIASRAASSDGLDYRENIALQRLMNIWGLNMDDYSDGI